MTETRQELARLILGERHRLSQQIAERHYQLMPAVDARFGAMGRERCVEDAGHHLSYLAQAVHADADELFAEYAVWARSMLESRGIPVGDLVMNLGVMIEVLAHELPTRFNHLIAGVIGNAIESLRSAQSPESFIEHTRPHASLAQAYLGALLDCDRARARQLILDAIEGGISIREIYLDVFQVTQYEVGRLWQTNRITVGDEHFCTAVTQSLMAELYPHIFSAAPRRCTFVAASVGDEMHEIGIRMVADFLELEGWDTHYLGARTPTASIVEAVCRRGADVLGLSATISYHVRIVGEIIQQVRKDSRCGRTRVMVGGYPFLIAPHLWKSVGADGFATDAHHAVAVARSLVGDCS